MVGVSQRKEIHMKRMTLLTSLIMVFSLLTATAAIADSGSKAGDGSRNTDTVMTQAQERARDQVREPSCQAGDPDSDCEAAQTRTQTREEAQVREHDGECLGTDKECEADQERSQARDRDQGRLNDGEGSQTRTQAREPDSECVGTDAECERAHEMNRAEIQERIMRRLAVFAEGSGDGEYLRAVVRWMWTHMYGPLSALFT